MSEPAVAFVIVATPGPYADYARRLSRSLMDHCTFEATRVHILAGREGPWPTGTITRPQVILDHWDTITAIGADYVYSLDADMLAVAPIGSEILGEIVATAHPGYAGHHRSTLPYDRSELSRAYVPMDEGDRYFAGGFYGGEAGAMWDLLEQCAWICEGPRPRWHDESALARCLIDSPPTTILSPSYCFPEDPSYYRSYVWKEDYEAIIVAREKPPDVRGDR